MTQLPSFVDLCYPQHICELDKALYGLRQSPRAWFHKLNSSLLQWGFTSSKVDSSIFVYHTDVATLIALIYVDDIIITSTDHNLVTTLINTLQHHFAIKDLGNLHHFLYVEVPHTFTSLY